MQPLSPVKEREFKREVKLVYSTNINTTLILTTKKYLPTGRYFFYLSSSLFKGSTA